MLSEDQAAFGAASTMQSVLTNSARLAQVCCTHDDAMRGRLVNACCFSCLSCMQDSLMATSSREKVPYFFLVKVCEQAKQVKRDLNTSDGLKQEHLLR